MARTAIMAETVNSELEIIIGALEYAKANSDRNYRIVAIAGAADMLDKLAKAMKG